MLWHNFFTVYGPWGRPDMEPFLFTKAILVGEPIKVFNHGKMMRDFTYIDGIVEGIIRIQDKIPVAQANWDASNSSESFAPYKIYNIGNNQPVQLMTFIEAIEKATGITAVIEYYPMQDGDVPATYADVEDLVKDFDYQPKTSVADGVQQFAQWYKSFYGH